MCLQLADRVPATHCHGTTEMRERYKEPTLSSRLVTDKNQHKHPHSLRLNPVKYLPDACQRDENLGILTLN